MKKIFVFIGLIILLWSCKKNETPFVSTGGYAGALDSMVSFTGDSGLTTQRLQLFAFKYDANRRIDSMYTNTGAFWSFTYNGNETNPYFIKDSLPYDPSAADPFYYLEKYYISYNAQNKKIKDSLAKFKIFYSSNIPVNISPARNVRVFTRTPASTIITVSNIAETDTTFFTANGEYASTHNRQVYNNSSIRANYDSFYTSEGNIFNQLNFSAGTERIIYFFYTSFIPLFYFDITEPAHLFKSISGTNQANYICTPGERIVVKNYYQKNTANQITSMVIATYSYSGNTLCNEFFTTVKFYYHA